MKLLSVLGLIFALLTSGVNHYVNLGTDALIVGAGFEQYASPGVYSRVYPLGDTPFIALMEKESGFYIITDREGIAMAEARYEQVEGCKENILIKQNGFWALHDRALNRLTDWDYSAIFPAGDGFYAFRTKLWDDSADELYILDIYGNERNSGTKLLYTDLRYSEGLCACMSAETGRYGYVDGEGVWALEPRYLWAGDFTGALAVVRTEEGCGLIDAQGNWILSPMYSEMTLSENYVICREKGSGTEYVYSRAPEGLIMILHGKSASAVSLGKYCAFYTDRYAYVFDADGTRRALFTGETRLFAGCGSQVIARDSNGMYVYDTDTRTMSGFYAEIRALRGADAYIAGEGDQEGNWKFGVLSMRGELLLNIEYDTISAPAPDLLAAEADRVITLFALTEEKAYQVYSITLD